MSERYPSLEQAKRALEEGAAEQRFWESHYGEFLEKFPEQIVAVRNGEVVASSTDLVTLLHEVEAKGLRMKHVWTRFITKRPDYFIL